MDFLKIALNMLKNMPEKEFEEKLLDEKIFREIESYSPLFPEEAVEQIKAISSEDLKALLEKNAPKKAKIISKHKKWNEVKKEFEKFKEKL